jgi:hypothetical protein
MRGRAVLILLGITALAAYSVGRQDAPANQPPAAATASPATYVKPMAFTAPAVEQPAPASPPPAAPDQPVRWDNKRKVESVLTAAAIAAIIVQASRDQYHASGRPCACPDDSARNGSACGGRSAYSRPGSAAPLCYPSDVPAAMIETYKKSAAR